MARLIIRDPTATSHIGNDLHRVFDIPYRHVLFGRPALESVTTEASKNAPTLNFLTASSYLAIFNYAGFEIIDVRRRRSSAGNRGEVEDRIRKLFPGVSDDELFSGADLDVRLVKPIDPKDLPGLALGLGPGRCRPPPPHACAGPPRKPPIRLTGVIVRVPGQGPLLELVVDGPEAGRSWDLAAGDGEWPQWGVQVLDGHGAWVQHVPFLEWPSGLEGPLRPRRSAGTPTRATIHRVPRPATTTSGGS